MRILIGQNIESPHPKEEVCIGQKGNSISRQKINQNLKTLHLAPMLFIIYIFFFYCKTGFLNPHPLVLVKIASY